MTQKLKSKPITSLRLIFPKKKNKKVGKKNLLNTRSFIKMPGRSDSIHSFIEHLLSVSRL